MLDEVDRLLTGAGKLHSDRPILSRNNKEWLTDSQIGNDDYSLGSVVPNVVFRYPMSAEQAAELITSERIRRRLSAAQPFQSSSTQHSMVQPYSVNRLHWHTLFLCFTEKVCYHFEGFGEDMEEEMVVAFTKLLSAHNWELISIDMQLQSDGCNCGVWIQVARDAYVDYTESEDFGTRTFVAFFEQWLQQRGVVRCDTRT